MESVIKIYPKVEDLCKIKTAVKCSEEGCTSIFSSESNLTLHLVKSHNKTNLWQNDKNSKQFYCPELSCLYNASKFFKSLKLVKQHYLKVHSSKDFKCNTCEATFSTESIRNSHSDYCGVIFKCCDCIASYKCYETLKTHGRRKKHHILEKTQYRDGISVPVKTLVKLSNKKNVLILPKTPINVEMVVAPSVTNKITINQGIQTNPEIPTLKTKMTQVDGDVITVKQTSNESQTDTFKKMHLTAETQTVGDYINMAKRPYMNEPFEESSSRKSIKTQTNSVTSRTASCNTSFNLDDFDFTVNSEVEKYSSSTQTYSYHPSIYSSSTTTHDSIHTDTSDLLSNSLSDNLSSFDSPFFNCHIETQTDFMLQNELFNCDYYTNMYTQTCDDILMGLGFNDIQTQTVTDDNLRSVESQTVMSHTKKASGCYSKDVTNMETQTDMEFKMLLEEINS